MNDQDKLTLIQNKVIWCLQNGWITITTNEMKGAEIANTANQNFRINNRVFWNLVDKGLIYQTTEWPFDYVLTTKGKLIKTKPVKF